jgi:hypothetical protein
MRFPALPVAALASGARRTAGLSAPDNPMNEPNPSFVFSESEPGSGFECRLDGTSPTTWRPALYVELESGLHSSAPWRVTDSATKHEA